MEHPVQPRYRAVWERTLRNKQLSAGNVAASRFFFDFPDHPTPPSGAAVPRRFDTYAIICGLPFPEPLQRVLASLWQHCLTILDHPLAYGVEPAHLHTEIFLFQRPEEMFTSKEVNAGIRTSLLLGRQTRSFRVRFCYPFVTPDGTIVAPGLDDPSGTVDALRLRLRQNLLACPRRQSRWLHLSLGRILEPIVENRLRPLLDLMQSHWGEVVAETSIDELLWVWEKQWYMLDQEVLHRCRLA